MLTLRKLLLEDADADSECCSFLERSSNKNSSWGAWSCTIVVSFTANTDTKQKTENVFYHCNTSNCLLLRVRQHNLILAIKICHKWSQNCQAFAMIRVLQINNWVWPECVIVVFYNKMQLCRFNNTYFFLQTSVFMSESSTARDTNPHLRILNVLRSSSL